ncbi:MAG TPA: M14 family metallopeptidase [Casimicrobiaceae bacterium]|nr:M14 family metallopeptidase [Casimicrobiaceae bacterium]
MSTDPVTGFSATYAEARDRFTAAARGRGLAVVRHVHPTARGAEGEALSIDVAALGPANARSVLLLISGTHGAEGFCGSGCQVNFLRDDAFFAEMMASGVRIVFLHALNPYGFSHIRRTNEDNVDLNRNFRDWTTPPPANAAYAEVHDFMVPATWPPSPANEARLTAYVQERGERALQNAVSGGQCEFPDGLFYGGSRPAWSNGVLRKALREHAAQAASLAWIDFHTGLGPRGYGEKIYSGRDVPADVARAKAWWGSDVTSFHDGSSTSAPLTGVNYNAAYEECPQAAYTGIAIEYGTQPMMAVLQALRGDQWLENHPDAPAELRRSIKRAVRDAFYQDVDDWKRTIHEQALAHAKSAIAHLRS